MARVWGVLLICLSIALHAGVAIVPGDEAYFINKDENFTLLYTKQNNYSAKISHALTPSILKAYSQSFGFVMDESLYVGLLSQQNQVANGFITPFPYNLQMLYMGGALKTDYFNSTSWLKTLLYHETTHNFQVNAKASEVTQGIHTVMGNGALIFGYFPLISLPNVTITSQLLEGNAVLNESWHNNGGRLYSGRFKAETLMQAKAGHINPQFLYNEKIHTFPYYDRHYIVGGFFQLYLAQKYGLKKTNSYFYNHSKSWLWPFQTNKVFEMTFGVDYEVAVADFEQYLFKELEGFVKAKGEIIARSKLFAPLNSNCDKIYFLTSDAQRAPLLNRLFKSNKKLLQNRKSYFWGKVITQHDNYYTQASGYVGPTERKIGLFNAEGKLLRESRSKVVEGYVNGSKMVYLDVPSSFDAPQLYVDDTFYTQVNSSVFIDREENLYYFKQKDKTRTLYRNREALYEYEGYYGVISDVNLEGGVYFVASSAKGSTLYLLEEGKVHRTLDADNIVDARLINEQEVLAVAVEEDDYTYRVLPIEKKESSIYVEKLFFEDKNYFGSVEKDKVVAPMTLEAESYTEYLQLHPAGSFAQVGATTQNDGLLMTYYLATSFVDPLMSNALILFAESGADAVGRVGMTYQNNAHLLGFGATVYGVYNTSDTQTYYYYNSKDNNYTAIDKASDHRSYGVNSFLSLPLYKEGYENINLRLDYTQDYDVLARAPLSLSLNLSQYERFAQSRFANFRQSFKGFGVYDRDDLSFGAHYDLSHDLLAKFYLGMALDGVWSDVESQERLYTTRGVKVSRFKSRSVQDPSTVTIYSLEHTRYAKQVGVGEINLYRQFDIRALFFTFPLSLTQEGFYAKQRHYVVQDFDQSSAWSALTHYNETTVGLELEILFFNRLPLPLNFEYIYNDHTQERHSFRFELGTFSF